jgi:hypothetical protein
MNCETCKYLKRKIVKKDNSNTKISYNSIYCKKYGELYTYYDNGQLYTMLHDKCLNNQKLQRLKEILK